MHACVSILVTVGKKSCFDERSSCVAAESRVSFIRDVGKSDGTHLSRMVLDSSF